MPHDLPCKIGGKKSRRADSNRFPALIASVRSVIAERCTGLRISHKGRLCWGGGGGEDQSCRESMGYVSPLSARQIVLDLPPITGISVACQARDESQRNGHQGGQREE